MAPTLSEDEIDDLLYFARTGETQDLTSTIDELCKRENVSPSQVLLVAKDPQSGNGPLHMAAANGYSAVVTSIITILSQPTPQNAIQLTILNAQNASGNTPLHWAALNGHLECVKALIDAGGDPTLTNHAGHDPVYEAELNDKKEVVEWVLKEGEGLEEGIGGPGGEGDEQENAENIGTDHDDIIDDATRGEEESENVEKGYGETMEDKVRAEMSKLGMGTKKGS